MDLKRSSFEPSNAFERMDGETYTEYRALKASGMFLDPERYLSFRERDGRPRSLKMVVEDSGLYFMDTARGIKYRLDKDYFFTYHSGLHAVEEERIRGFQGPLVLLDNLLEFWRRPGTGLLLVADHLNHREYLSPAQKAELDSVQRLYQKEQFVINPMLQKKAPEPAPPPVQVLSLED